MRVASTPSTLRSMWRDWRTRLTERWLMKHLPPGETVVLHRSNIFILPTRPGLMFVLTAFVIFIAAINYALSLAFALAFLMISLFLLAILHTFYNLRDLSLSGQSAEPAFAGENAVFNILVRSFGSKHESLELYFIGGDTACADLLQNRECRVQLAIPVRQRGLFKAPRLIVQSTFPLGLWRAWSRLDLAQTCLVYPQPIPCQLRQTSRSDGVSGESSSITVGVEDFHGLRNYQVGDSLKQISWKTLARGQGLKVKQFVDGAEEQRILDWHMFSGLDKEERLSRLCYLVLQMENTGLDYGLSMPGLSIAPDRGEQHKRRLLEELALWP